MQDFFRRRSEFLGRFPGLKSIVVLAIPYASRGHPPVEMTPGHGRVARYAKGKDYHDEIRQKLQQLADFFHAQAGPDTQVAVTVDTSAVQERVLAEAAGLGFFGKNTCLIHPQKGSYFFLATLLTNVELTPDPPMRWDCGSCTLCIEACPTQALKKPYELDAGRCISALTIELRGPIPEPLRPHMGNWLFGCDICQEVCPYNRGPGEGAREETLPLNELLTIRTEAQFKTRFAGTALTRAKREGLLRNAAVAAGNSRDPALTPPLQEALEQDASPIVREHAAWALKTIQNSPRNP